MNLTLRRSEPTSCRGLDSPVVWHSASFPSSVIASLGLIVAFSDAYNSSKLEPYTGYIEKDDFLEDIMKPQMEALFYNYDADILWCDVGGPTVFPEIGKWMNITVNGRSF